MHNSHVIKYNQLAKKMLLSNIDTKKNFVVSPLSFYLLLALLTHATDGNSKQEILDVLGDENGLDDFVNNRFHIDKIYKIINGNVFNEN